MEELDTIVKSFEEMIEAKKKDNESLEAEVAQAEQEVAEQERQVEQETKETEEEMSKLRLRRVMKRNKLAEQIKDQQELLVSLQQQVDTFVTRTFPTLG